MTLDTSWQDRAACRNADPEIFFSLKEAERAKAYCRVCPVLQACLDFANSPDPFTGYFVIGRVGIWGGMKEYERAAYRGQLREQARHSA